MVRLPKSTFSGYWCILGIVTYVTKIGQQFWFLNSSLNIYLFIWLYPALVAAGRIFCSGRQTPEHAELCDCNVLAQLPLGIWDLSSQIRDRIHVPFTGRWILNHWTTRKVLWNFSWHNIQPRPILVSTYGTTNSS